jgi:hypothetical protein
MKRIALVLAAAAIFVVAATALPASAASSGSVAVKITVASPCLVVGPSSGIEFPPMKFGDGGPAKTDMSVDNCSGVDEDVYARGTNATGTSTNAVWTLSGDFTNNVDLFNLTLTGTSQTLALDPQSRLWRTMGPGDSDSIRAYINMPTAGSGGAGDTMSMQIVYTASL